MKILGIDPGIATTGFAIIQSGISTPKILEMGTITTPAGMPTSERLIMLRKDLKDILEHFTPTIASMEELFFASNTKTAITVAHARGVLLECIASTGIEVYEFTPLQVKQAVTGYGKADKKQMQQMLHMVFGTSSPFKQDDAADALGIALCLHQSRALLNLL